MQKPSTPLSSTAFWRQTAVIGEDKNPVTKNKLRFLLRTVIVLPVLILGAHIVVG